MSDERGFGNIIIYIIFAIIAIVSSIKGKKREVPRGEPTGESREPRSGFPDDLFDDDDEFYGEEVARPQMSTATASHDKMSGSATRTSGAGSDAGKETASGHSALDAAATEKRFEELLQATETGDVEIIDDEQEGVSYELVDILHEFDGRRAVIYKEIFDRKEF